MLAADGLTILRLSLCAFRNSTSSELVCRLLRGLVLGPYIKEWNNVKHLNYNVLWWGLTQSVSKLTIPSWDQTPKRQTARSSRVKAFFMVTVVVNKLLSFFGWCSLYTQTPGTVKSDKTQSNFIPFSVKMSITTVCLNLINKCQIYDFRDL